MSKPIMCVFYLVYEGKYKGNFGAKKIEPRNYEFNFSSF